MFSSEQAVAWVRRTAAVIEEHATELTKLDAAIGDGDHGTNMARGFRAVMERLDALPADPTIGAVLKAVSMALIGKVGGASGPLYGTFYLAMGRSIGDQVEVDDAAVAGARKGVAATIPLVARKGRASYLGERSRDHQDPGATSSHMILEVLADVVNDR